jgi:hypothetical protein
MFIMQALAAGWSACQPRPPTSIAVVFYLQACVFFLVLQLLFWGYFGIIITIILIFKIITDYN